MPWVGMELSDAAVLAQYVWEYFTSSIYRVRDTWVALSWQRINTLKALPASPDEHMTSGAKQLSPEIEQPVPKTQQPLLELEEQLAPTVPSLFPSEICPAAMPAFPLPVTNHEAQHAALPESPLTALTTQAKIELSEFVSMHPILGYTSATPAHPSLPHIVQTTDIVVPSLLSNVVMTDQFLVECLILISVVIVFILANTRVWSWLFYHSRRTVLHDEREELIALLRERMDRWHERANSWEERARHWEERARRWKAYSKRWKERARQAEGYAESLSRDDTLTASSSTFSFIDAIGNPVEISFSSVEHSPLLGLHERLDVVHSPLTSSVNNSPDTTHLGVMMPLPLSPIPETELDDATFDGQDGLSPQLAVGACSDEAPMYVVPLDASNLIIYGKVDDFSIGKPGVSGAEDPSLSIMTDTCDESMSSSVETTLAEQAAPDTPKETELPSDMLHSPESQDLSTEYTNPFATPSTSLDSISSIVLESTMSVELRVTDSIKDSENPTPTIIDECSSTDDVFSLFRPMFSSTAETLKVPNDLIDFISPILSGSTSDHHAARDTSRGATTGTIEATLSADISVPMSASSSKSTDSDANGVVNERKFVQEIRSRLFASASAPCAIKRFHYEKDAQGPVGQLVDHFNRRAQEARLESWRYKARQRTQSERPCKDSYPTSRTRHHSVCISFKSAEAAVAKT